MLPGKRYTPDELLRIAWKRRWFIAIPLLVIASITAVVALFLPDRYRASTSIIIVPQRVPENFVRSTVTAQLSERLSLISQQILSRTRLERIVQEFNLYERERGRMIMEDVIEQMRRDISLNVNANRNRDGASSFNVSFESPDARLAMRVTERLASLFVQENLEDRELLADQTNQFLQGQLEEAKRKLIEKENALKEFRLRNNGILPDQVTANLQLMQTAQMQLQGVVESTNRDQDRLAVLERNYADASAAAAPVVGAAPPSDATPTDTFTGSAAQQLEAARAALRALQLRLKPEHPDIGRAKRMIAELETKAEAEALNQPLSAQTPATVVVDKAAQARLEQMRNEIQELRQRIAAGKREAARLQDVAQGHAARVQAAPALEAQLTELMRDYATLQESYTSLLRKSEDSKIAVNLERRQIGEQFRILDGARLPERPVSPNRLRINLMGILGGLLAGLGLVALLEYKDTSFKSDDDVVSTLSLPVLAVIPVMTNAGERRTQRRRRMLLAVSASVGCMTVAAAVMVVWRFNLVDRWFH
jgi:polysaccharide chain length determinant protein (PEP-CTERM system associated)